jgi:hypothetical protein
MMDMKRQELVAVVLTVLVAVAGWGYVMIELARGFGYPAML